MIEEILEFTLLLGMMPKFELSLENSNFICEKYFSGIYLGDIMGEG